MKLQFKIKTVYGKILYYPMNEAAKAIVGISGQKTLVEYQLDGLFRAGFEVELESEHSELELRGGK